MSHATAALPAAAPPTDEDALRAQHWALLARLLVRAPDAATLAQLAGVQGADGTPLGAAWAGLARAAAAADEPALSREYFNLFIGVGRGELLPYASFYLTGFLNERPLAELRGDLARLGLARAEGRWEPEDHIATLAEAMAGLIAPDDGLAAPRLGCGGIGAQAFFARHIAPWAGMFWDDLAAAPSARFYRAVAALGAAFSAVETQGFAMAESESGLAAPPAAASAAMAGVAR